MVEFSGYEVEPDVYETRGRTRRDMVDGHRLRGTTVKTSFD